MILSIAARNADLFGQRKFTNLRYDKRLELKTLMVCNSHNTGDPTLEWYKIQDLVLKESDIDILLVLDCCYAAQSGRGRNRTGFEVLAAAAMGVKTREPGPTSFTSVFVEEAKKVIMSKVS